MNRTLERPEWVPSDIDTKLCDNHSYDTRFALQTGLRRGNYAANMVAKYLPDKNSVNLLEVGLGFSNLDILCPVEPYFLTGFLEYMDINYSAILVDKDPKIIEDIKNRSRIFCTRQEFREDAEIAQAWRNYLRFTKQEDGIVFEEVEGLRMVDTAAPYCKSLLTQGVYHASIPRSFSSGLSEGKVVLSEGDISSVDLTQFPGFDFVSFMNVAYYLSTKGQKLAMYNIANSLNEDGCVILNDVKDPYQYGPSTDSGDGIDSINELRKKPMVYEFGGWMDSGKLRDLRLKVETTEVKKDSVCFMVLRKY